MYRRHPVHICIYKNLENLTQCREGFYHHRVVCVFSLNIHILRKAYIKNIKFYYEKKKNGFG